MGHVEHKRFMQHLQAEFPQFNVKDLHNWYVQFRQLKASAPDAVLFYRMGDFYEAFDDDAKLVAELLDVTLTWKEFVRGSRAETSKRERSCPMAGMPYHAVERYVGQLVAAGYRVAIAEQISATPSSKSDTRPKSVFAAGLEQSAAQRDIVERKIVRLITPGTIIDSGVLPAAQNNYLVAVIAEQGRIGLAYADLTTGEFACTEFAGERAEAQLQGELARLNAAEVLVPEDANLRLPGLEPASAKLTTDLEFMTKAEREMLLPGERVARRTERESNARWAHGHVTGVVAWRWDARNARDALLRQFGVQSLAGYGLNDKLLAARAAGALIQYVHETQNGAATQITSLRSYTTSDTMLLDPQTRRNLELLEGSGGRAKGSLVSVLDKTRSPMGARLLRRWVGQPLLSRERLEGRQDAVQHFVDQGLRRAEIRELLRQVGDMERAVNRVIQGVTVATPRDMVRLRDALRAVPQVVQTLDGWQVPGADAQVVVADEDDAPAWEDDLGEWTPDEPVPASLTDGVSLREQRESRRRARARYAGQDELFGDDLFDEPAPAPQPRPAPQPQPAAPAMRVSPRPPVAPRLDACDDVLVFLEAAIDDDPPALLGASNYLRAGGDGEAPRRVIRPGFDQGMDDVVAASKEAQNWITGLQETERERTGIKHLRVDYNKVFGYYIEIPRSLADQVPADYIRKQTLTTGERYITPELKDYENIVINAQERLTDLERRAFSTICAVVAEAGPRLLASAQALAELDVYAALAEAAVRGNYTRPVLFDDTRLSITNGRHPVVEQSLEEQFIPNDAELDTDQHQILLITGPNMAGKSTVMRQIALIVLMAQIGSFVPAERADIGLVDRIFTRIGAQDDIATGQSTFMVEMTETAALLLQSTRRSLIILDEVGRGTSTYDGMAIARAVVEYLHNEPRLGCRTLFATHYHELTELEDVLPRVQNYHMAAIEQDGHVVFLHELRRGGADRSYGIHVAELAGIPRPVIRRASELLAEFEQSFGQRDAAPAPAEAPASTSADARPGLFDTMPHPLIEMVRRININELSPIEALTKLYELQRLAQK